MSQKLMNKVGVITGGTSGIGRNYSILHQMSIMYRITNNALFNKPLNHADNK